MSSGEGWAQPGTVERVWALCYACAVGLFFVVLAVSLALGGHGIALSEGEFLLLKGRSRHAMNQELGLLFFLLTYLFLALGGVFLLLSLLVAARQGTLNPDRIFSRDSRDRRLVALIRIPWLLASLPLLVALLRALM